jgi:hypothetical protein
MDKDILLNVFENKERSGGDKARSISYNNITKELTSSLLALFFVLNTKKRVLWIE